MDPNEQQQRQQWLRLLACSTPNELASVLDPLIDAFTGDADLLRRPEVGLALVTGRVGATGEPFGLGEMTVTRCVVQLADTIGVGYVRGRAPDHARRIAIADALLQGDRRSEIVDQVLAPLAAAETVRRNEASDGAERTRVQFLTMVRGN